MTGLDGFTKRTQQKMERIENVAAAMLPLPLADIKIADIAKQAGVSQVTIYNYYGSKEKLLQVATERVVDHQLQQFKEVITGSLSFEEKLKQIILLKKQSAHVIDLHTFNELMQMDDIFREKMLKKQQEQSMPLLFQLIAEGRDKQLIRPSVRDETLLFYLNMISQVFTQLDTIQKMPSPIETLVEDFLNMFFYGILRQSEG